MSDGRAVSTRAASIAARSAVEIVAVVDPLHVPAVGGEARHHVLAEGERGRSVDRDLVVVVEHVERAEAEMSGERGGFGGDALHQVAVADERPHVVVEKRGVRSRAVEAGSEHLARHRHADRVAEPLAERSGGGLDALRVSRARGVPESSSRAGGTAAAPRSAGRSRRGGGARTGAPRRGRRRGRSGRGSRQSGCCRVVAQELRPERRRPSAPARAELRDAPTWRPRPCRRRGTGWCRWPAGRAGRKGSPWVRSPRTLSVRVLLNERRERGVGKVYRSRIPVQLEIAGLGFRRTIPRPPEDPVRWPSG